MNMNNFIRKLILRKKAGFGNYRNYLRVKNEEDRRALLRVFEKRG